MNKFQSPPKALTIAGSDSSGSAGIQADLKTFTARGVFGTSVTTIITAQNTTGVKKAYTLPLDIIHAQIHIVLEDIEVDVIKTGLLGKVDVVLKVAELLPAVPLVVDPVLVNGQGQLIVSQDTILSYQQHLFPKATIITPNIDETKLLTNLPQLVSTEDFEKAARILHALGPKFVLIKGGQSPDKHIVFDVLYDGKQLAFLENPRLPVENPHGIGCTFASAIAAEIAKGNSVPKAVQIALQYVQRALAGALHWTIGQGRLPLNHFAGLEII